MSLPAPNLDDRTFQQLVDEAKRYVQLRCPTWTNHNVSDPGVTLIETFAWMTDLLLYRLNRVPDRNHVKFLELIGLELFPPTAARTGVSFRLSSHQDAAVRIAKGTEVSTPRTAADEAITFTTVEDLEVVPATSVVVGSVISDDELRDHTPAMALGQAFACFAEPPKVGDALYIGFDQPAPRTLVLLEFQCEVSGHGIDPRNPPLSWEAWNGQEWETCDVERDATGGLNISGAVELHMPSAHARSAVGGVMSAWMRCRVAEPEGRRPYRSSPRIVSVTGATMGGDVDAVHGEEVNDELLGASEGVPGQSYVLERAPVVLTAEPIVLEVQPEDEPVQEWHRVPTFADSGPDDRHFCLDPASGEVRFGPAVRQPDGGVRRYGAVPAKGATMRVRGYRTGGGGRGNVAERAISRLRSSIPYVATVYNRRAATGGVDGERVDEARDRARVVLSARNRAVTAADYEDLTRQAAPQLARVRCLLEEQGPDAGALRVLIVPAVAQERGRFRFADLLPDEETRTAVERYLAERRVVGTRVLIQPPTYMGITVVTRITAATAADPERLREDVLDALHCYFNPLIGGPEGTGWPFGRPVDESDVHRALQGVRGLDRVERPLLFAADPRTGMRSDPRERIDLGPTNLVVSYQHDIQVA